MRTKTILRVFQLLCATVLGLSLAACGGTEEPFPTPEDDTRSPHGKADDTSGCWYNSEQYSAGTQIGSYVCASDGSWVLPDEGCWHDAEKYPTGTQIGSYVCASNGSWVLPAEGCWHNSERYPVGTQIGSYVCASDGSWN